METDIEMIKKSAMTREELDRVCECEDTREFHSVKEEYCFAFRDDNSPCPCKKFLLQENSE